MRTFKVVDATVAIVADGAYKEGVGTVIFEASIPANERPDIWVAGRGMTAEEFVREHYAPDCRIEWDT